MTKINEPGESSVSQISFIDLFIMKCELCKTIFDFTDDKEKLKDASSQLEGKNIKRQCLLELIEVMDSTLKVSSRGALTQSSLTPTVDHQESIRDTEESVSQS